MGWHEVGGRLCVVRLRSFGSELRAVSLEENNWSFEETTLRQ